MAEQTAIRVESEDRFDRFRRIEWWDQNRLAEAKILVIGAGALGNEILKNLALLGIGNVFIADIDFVESSNLSRSILFRERDIGRPKAEAATTALRDIYPDIKARAFHGDVMFDLGLGVYRWADVVIAGLDNREARLHVNRCCLRVKRPFIDAATEALRGAVRVFLPNESCFECTMTGGDWAALAERRGGAGLRVEGLSGGRVPTTPVTSSVLAAIQTQEALKLLHGIDTPGGRGLIFDGLTNELYSVSYPRSEECNSHDPFQQVIRLETSTRTATPNDLLREGRACLGPAARIDLNRELLISLDCPKCGVSEPVLEPMARVSERRAHCPACHVERRPVTALSIVGGEEFANKPLCELGFPPFDIVAIREGFRVIGLEVVGDSGAVLGCVCAPGVRGAA